MFTRKDRQKCVHLFEKHYAGRKFSRALYKDLIAKHLVLGGRLLDAGCGRHLEFSREFASAMQIVGLDLEKKMNTRNVMSPFAVRGDLETLPFPGESFDLVISRSVVEHLHQPHKVFLEFHRVLKPGGRVIFSTPNLYDYVSIVAAITPYRWHRVLVGKMTGVPDDDIFPTLYRANTRSSLARQLHAAGFKEVLLKGVNHYPSYLMFSPTLFRLGMLYEKVTSLSCFEGLRGTLLCVFEKEGRRSAFAAKSLSGQHIEVGAGHVGA